MLYIIGFGSFDPKSATPEDDRLEFYQRQWEREPKTQSFYRSGERGYEDFTFQVTRTQAQVADPNKPMRADLHNFIERFIIAACLVAIATTIVQSVSNWQDEQELNEIQKKKSA